MRLEQILKKKVNQRSHKEKVFVAAMVIKESWADEEDSLLRAEDAAALILRRENWEDRGDGPRIREIAKEIQEYF